MFLGNVAYKNNTRKSKSSCLFSNIIGRIQRGVDQGAAVFLEIPFQYIKQRRIKGLCYDIFFWKENPMFLLVVTLGALQQQEHC